MRKKNKWKLSFSIKSVVFVSRKIGHVTHSNFWLSQFYMFTESKPKQNIKKSNEPLNFNSFFKDVFTDELMLLGKFISYYDTNN